MNSPQDGPHAGRTDGSAVQSVDRAISVLEILARSGGARVSAVAADIGVHKSTAFRLLAALETRGLVEQTHDRGIYQLSFGILRLASAIPGRLDLVRQAHPILDGLVAETGETVNVSVLRSHYAVNLDQAHGSAAVVALSWVAQMTPMHASASGKLLLAQLEDERSRSLLDEAGLSRHTDQTITDRDVFAAELARIRAEGYALSMNEFEEGLHSIAVPVHDHTSLVVAALSISGPGHRLDSTRMREMLEPLSTGAAKISARMGYLG